MKEYKQAQKDLIQEQRKLINNGFEINLSMLNKLEKEIENL